MIAIADCFFTWYWNVWMGWSFLGFWRIREYFKFYLKLEVEVFEENDLKYKF